MNSPRRSPTPSLLAPLLTAAVLLGGCASSSFTQHEDPRVHTPARAGYCLVGPAVGLPLSLATLPLTLPALALEDEERGICSSLGAALWGVHVFGELGATVAGVLPWLCVGPEERRAAEPAAQPRESQEPHEAQPTQRARIPQA